MPDVQDTPLTLADLTALNYTILVPYNGTIATGGNSLTDNLNIFYTVSDPPRNTYFPKRR